jgi:hypothetical protein
MADYSPATFEGETAFSSFISLVDAYISTQSILQESLKRDLLQEPGSDDEDRMLTSREAP